MVVHKQDLNEDKGDNATLFQEIPRFSEYHKHNAEARLHNYAADAGYQIIIYK
jgi:hypothetical protein